MCRRVRRRTNRDNADDDHGKVDHGGPDGASAADDRYDHTDAAIHAVMVPGGRHRWSSGGCFGRLRGPAITMCWDCGTA